MYIGIALESLLTETDLAKAKLKEEILVTS